ncbi:hypothetical protein ETAA8_31310 [Anatilimnocola aggregata]|uniref:Uncharacterized protein n=1 Tax=Anatilimnocola aggregata TaxID=2528021 RepID=A0A517YCY2_9BACT|nr:hypothetical protein [Anatilimnocola aggregata]QDU28039.1 hypothetical protein ETAA8_31310 [Anatilimnocola aggregata]
MEKPRTNSAALIVLLLVPVLYVGSYLALVKPFYYLHMEPSSQQFGMVVNYRIEGK